MSQAGQIVVVKHADGFGRANKPLLLSIMGCPDITATRQQQKLSAVSTSFKKGRQPPAAIVCNAFPWLLRHFQVLDWAQHSGT